MATKHKTKKIKVPKRVPKVRRPPLIDERREIAKLGLRIRDLRLQIQAMERQLTALPSLPGRWHGVAGMLAIATMSNEHLLAIMSKALRGPLPTDESRFAQIIAVSAEAGRRGLVKDIE